MPFDPTPTGARPLALDLFCGAGGAAMGLYRAGFDVIGVDIKPQPRYPFLFIQADAVAPPVDLARFALIWASPPCQHFSQATPVDRKADHPDLIEPVRRLLAGSAGALTIMENVPGAPLRRDIVLDGTMFNGLRVIRKRVFELNFLALQPSSQVVPGMVRRGGYTTVCGGGICSGTPRTAAPWHTEAAKRRAMGIDWMRRRELAQAIPPAYSDYLGRWAMRHLGREVCHGVG
jgi:DNA (cytosine-5)-methyltransferase 1